MASYEFTAKTVDEAKKAGLASLGISEDQAVIEVLEESAGFLGMGKRAKIRITQKATDGERAVQFLEGLSGKKKSLILAIAGIVGLLLILFGTFGEKKDKNEEISKNTKENISTLEYIEHLENKI